MSKLILLAILLVSSLSQRCIGQAGEEVDWWVVLKVPPKIGKLGFGYYDSSMQSGQFVYHDVKVDHGETALTLTLDDINSKQSEHIAWNDQPPPSGSGDSAHSKGFIAYNYQNSNGVLVTHSIPRYPSFEDGNILPTIGKSQNVFGQDIVCLSLSLSELDAIANDLLITWPLVYESTVTNTSSSRGLFSLSNKQFPHSNAKFKTYDLSSSQGYKVKAIFKNHRVNSSIFEDGLTYYLKADPLISETWGRPLQEASCGKYESLNVVDINLSGVFWSETDDHSKWAVAGDQYACYGDMNRMRSQWKRGGAFYCLNEPTLVAAMHAIISSHDTC